MNKKVCSRSVFPLVDDMTNIILGCNVTSSVKMGEDVSVIVSRMIYKVIQICAILPLDTLQYWSQYAL